MAQFPLALAVEPKLLPYATANGFSMDHKVKIAHILTLLGVLIFLRSIGTLCSEGCLKRDQRTRQVLKISQVQCESYCNWTLRRCPFLVPS